MRLLVEGNLQAAVYSALDQITVNDMRGIYWEAGYIAIWTCNERGVLWIVFCDSWFVMVLNNFFS